MTQCFIVFSNDKSSCFPVVHLAQLFVFICYFILFPLVNLYKEEVITVNSKVFPIQECILCVFIIFPLTFIIGVVWPKKRIDNWS